MEGGRGRHVLFHCPEAEPLPSIAICFIIFTLGLQPTSNPNIAVNDHVKVMGCGSICGVGRKADRGREARH